MIPTFSLLNPEAFAVPTPNDIERFAASKPEGWTSDKWATPWSVVEHFEDEFGRFDLDPCCEEITAKAATFFTKEQDGLSRPWFGNVWVNPPFSNPRPWIEKAHQEVMRGNANTVVVLLPAAIDTRWFHDVVLPFAEIRFWKGRIRFLGWEGTPIPAPKSPSIFAIFKGCLDA